IGNKIAEARLKPEEKIKIFESRRNLLSMMNVKYVISAYPLDEKIIFNSVKKTGRLVVVDSDWKRAGVTSEISALVMDKCFRYLKAPVKRVALPDIPTPASYILEDALYPGAKDIKRAVKEVLK
ncbi:hypothetical protein KKH42_00680, partial [bacterium]|nr:hypothetical protein [bacterium]